MTYDPKKRVSAEQALKDPFFKQTLNDNKKEDKDNSQYF